MANAALQDALRQGPRKKARASEPLVGYGRHFGRAVYAVGNIPALITKGMIRLAAGEPEELLTAEQRKELCLFKKLLTIVPGLKERIAHSSDEEIGKISEWIQKGVSSARADDTKGLKSAVIEWITPRGVPLNPPLSRNVKSNRGFHHPVTGSLLCPAGVDWKDPRVRSDLANGVMTVSGDQWPVLVYENQEYDPEHPWEGLFRSKLLVWAFKFIFTSPSSVEKEAKATRSGNARIHGMTQVTAASIAYTATQLRFSLTSASVFCRSDTSTDSERFYLSVLDFLDDPEEKEDVDDLLNWWNCQIFPNHVVRQRGGVSKTSALAKLKEQRVQKRAQDQELL